MKRGDYDHNHSLLSTIVTAFPVLIGIAVVMLGGLTIGLFILSKF